MLFILFSIQSNAQAPYWNWASTAGGTNSDRANAMTYTHDGNLLVTGFFQDTVIFESTTLGVIGFGLFIAKYNLNGNLIWAKKVASASYGIEPQKIFEDSTGNIIITGYFGDIIDGGNISFTSSTDSFTSYGSRDIFIAKFDINAIFIWANNIGAIEDEKIASCITDETIIIQGSRFSQLITTTANSSDTLSNDFTWHVWSAIYNTSGQLQFLSDLIKNTSQVVPIGISADEQQNFYFSGNYYGKPIIGTLPDTAQLSNAGGLTNIYLIKFHWDSVEIQRVWWQFIGGTGNDYLHGADVNGTNEILLTGTYANSGYFGNDSGSIVLNSVNPGNENFICTYQSNGNLIFAKNSGYNISGSITSTQIIHDDSLIYLCGKYSGINSPVFGEGADTFSSLPAKNFFVAAYTDSGVLHWVRGSLSSFIDGLNAITLDDSGHVYTAGYYTLYCVIDTGETDSLYIPSAGVDDIYMGRLGYKITIEDTVIIDTTFVQNFIESNSLFAYPNPASNYLNIDLNNSFRQSSIEIYSINGKIIFNENLSADTKRIFLNTSNLMSGNYIIRIKTPYKMLTGKFTVIREE